MKSTFGMLSMRPINSGPLKWPSPRTRMWVSGKWRRISFRTRRMIIAFSSPNGRLPGRSTAAIKCQPLGPLRSMGPPGLTGGCEACARLQWHFCSKAHIGVDKESGLVQTLVTTAANVSDISQTAALLHGQEQEAWLDAGHVGVEKREDMQAALAANGQEVKWHIA
jgi:hypothetical protein